MQESKDHTFNDVTNTKIELEKCGVSGFAFDVINEDELTAQQKTIDY